MGNRKTAVGKRILAFTLAVLMGLSTISDSIAVYAEDIYGGNTKVAGTSSSGDDDWSGFQREGAYISVTPLYGDNTVTTSDVNKKATESNSDKSIVNSFRVEEYVGTQEAELSLPSQNQASLLFISKSIWSRFRSILSSEKSKWRVYAREDNKISGEAAAETLQSGSTYTKNIVWCEDSSKRIAGTASPEVTVTSDSTFLSTYADNGIYRTFLKEYFASGNQYGYSYDFSKLTNDTVMSEKDANDLINAAYAKGYLAKAQQVWSYITRIDTSSGYAADPGSLIEE